MYVHTPGVCTTVASVRGHLLDCSDWRRLIHHDILTTDVLKVIPCDLPQSVPFLCEYQWAQIWSTSRPIVRLASFIVFYPSPDHVTLQTLDTQIGRPQVSYIATVSIRSHLWTHRPACFWCLSAALEAHDKRFFRKERLFSLFRETCTELSDELIRVFMLSGFTRWQGTYATICWAKERWVNLQ